MYILITGKHPIYVYGDTVEKYKARVINPKYEFTKRFSEYEFQ